MKPYNSDKLRIAIIGGTGLLGSTLANEFKSKHDVRSFSRIRSNNICNSINTTIDFNFLEPSLSLIFNTWKPHLLINAIAVVNLEQCEINYSLAHYVNCSIAQQLAVIAKNLNIYYVHISTDHFYNDNLLLHDEMHPIKILNNYAKSKFLAEEYITQSGVIGIIIRTNIIGYRRRRAKSFFEWLLYSLENEKTYLYENYYTSPIAASLLGNIVLGAYSARLHGIYNIASSVVVSKLEFGILVAKRFNFSLNKIESIKYDANIFPNRALTLGLDVAKIENALGIKMPTVEETIEVLYNDK